MVNVTATVKMLNARYTRTHVRVCREWNEIQIRVSSDKDYNGEQTAHFDMGHTSDSKLEALNDAEDYCRDFERRANTAAEDAAFHKYVAENPSNHFEGIRVYMHLFGKDRFVGLYPTWNDVFVTWCDLPQVVGHVETWIIRSHFGGASLYLRSVEAR